MTDARVQPYIEEELWFYISTTLYLKAQ